jgi:hypothetical protein
LPDRIGDGCQPGVLWTSPEPDHRIDANAPPTPTQIPRETTALCEPNSPPCPECPESPWVILAAIRLPQRGIPITADMIDNEIRSIV